MSRRAFCVVHLDTSVEPPVVLGAAIYSESAHSLTGAINDTRFAFDVLDSTGDDYGQAKQKLLAYLKYEMSPYAWVVKLLEAS